MGAGARGRGVAFALAAGLACAGMPVLAAADGATERSWRVEPAASRDLAAGAASSPSVDGARVALFRGPEGAWLYVRAPAGMTLGTAAPELQVDDAAPFALEPLRRDYERLGLEFFRATPRDFAMLVWPGAGPAGEPIRSLLAGTTLRVAFVDAQGASRAVRIELTAAAPAIREALKLDGYDAPPALQAESLRRLTVALNRACMAGPEAAGVGTCLSAVSGCSQASVDATDLLACAIERRARVPAAWREPAGR